ncbi:hypothetical protein WOLCODRAFT_27938 [Wolfiporia cocos MD-104 SS10]|uniref:Uncharacterized protein n=1 Tax=Wolfiporia cocos (strain MD-104) TaxID=742152 RepID=A0A2H3IZU6_WOLCO|nr:hypothetical protein WOLCODRAFT_27938 [Wolfiporia cocos MD-104 SS10]
MRVLATACPISDAQARGILRPTSGLTRDGFTPTSRSYVGMPVTGFVRFRVPHLAAPAHRCLGVQAPGVMVVGTDGKRVSCCFLLSRL